jgi:hypothetical protein
METGSSTATRTIGIVAVARFAASVARCAGRDQDGDAGADQLLDDRRQRLGPLLGPAVDNGNVVAIGPAERREAILEGTDRALVLLPRPRMDKADARDLDLGGSRRPRH